MKMKMKSKINSHSPLEENKAMVKHSLIVQMVCVATLKVIFMWLILSIIVCKCCIARENISHNLDQMAMDHINFNIPMPFSLKDRTPFQVHHVLEMRMEAEYL